jgi:Zn-dependent protease with chaperone function
VPMRAPDRRRRILVGLAAGLCYGAVIAGGMILVPRHGTGQDIGRMAVYVVALLVLASVIAPLAIVRLGTSSLPQPQRDRLTRLADTIGVRVRDFRVLKGRRQKLASAAQVGTLPGLRYVVLTDYLVDHLDAQELDAVVAHELGHARRHHLLIKLGAVVMLWAGLEAVVLSVGHQSGGGAAALLFAPLILAFPIGILLVQGLVGVRLETAADELAARYVGAEPLASALEKLGRLNNTKLNTGRGWAIIAQHPGLQTRIDHLIGAGGQAT